MVSVAAPCASFIYKTSTTTDNKMSSENETLFPGQVYNEQGTKRPAYPYT